MKFKIIVLLFLFIVINVFGTNNTEDTIYENISVVTGGWQEIDKNELNESILNFVINYLYESNLCDINESINSTWSIESVWMQLIQGRRYLIAYDNYLQIINKDDLADDIFFATGLLVLREDFDGSITIENEYKNTSLLDFLIKFFINKINDEYGGKDEIQ